MAQPPTNGPGVSWRAVLLGLFFCFVIAAGEPYGVLVLRGSPMAADFSTGAALFLFFLLTFLANPLAKVLTGSRLRRGELGTVYIMMIVAAAIPSWGFTMNLIPLLGGFIYYATPENNWAQLIQPLLPDWLVAASEEAVWKLFEGSAKGEQIPWLMWAQPLLAWGLFALSLYFVTLCILVILRRQWVERERLLFPLATLPLEMSTIEEGRLLPAFFRNYLTWIGFAIPALINSINALHTYYNFIPRIHLTTWVPILRNSISLNCTPRFEMIGLSYLLSLDVSFGVWFFAILNIIITGIQRMVGWSIGPTQPYSSPAPPTVAHLALGALFVLVFTSFWNGRDHIGGVLRKAFKNDATIDDSDELMSYRVAVFGGLLGIGLCLAFLVATGLNLLTALVFLVSSLVIFIGLARIVSQTGLAYGRATVPAPIFTVNTLGTSTVGTSGLVGLALHFPWAADVRTFVMASVATGLKLAEVTRLEYRKLFVAIIAAIVVTLIGSSWAVIKLAYTYGGINLSGWQFGHMTTYTANWITRNINNPQPIHGWHLGFAGIGAVLMVILTYIKGRFIGFPIHPIGMTLGLTYPVNNVWFSVFIAWLLKGLILKYGGAKLYKSLRPFFLGLVLGAFGSAGLWLIIDSITGVTGNIFTLG